jgi:hypothetical protein
MSRDFWAAHAESRCKVFVRVEHARHRDKFLLAKVFATIYGQFRATPMDLK